MTLIMVPNLNPSLKTWFITLTFYTWCICLLHSALLVQDGREIPGLEACVHNWLRITNFAIGTTNAYLIDNELIEYVNEGHE